MQSVITARQLVIGYGGKPISPPMEINCPAGKITAILGLNGAGKSTLLLTLAGLLPAISGTITVQGQAMQQSEPQALARLRSIVLTGRQEVVPSMTAMELFLLSREAGKGWFQQTQLHGERMTQVIELMQLGDLLPRPLYTLSDGEYQRIMIARALVQETPIVLLDEPTAHLDIVQRKATFDLLKQLPQFFGVSIVFSTHEIDRALHIADHFIVVEKGKAAVSGQEDLVRSHSAWKDYI
jgi:iron complex transport system ATP-binding protein